MVIYLILEPGMGLEVAKGLPSSRTAKFYVRSRYLSTQKELLKFRRELASVEGVERVTVISRRHGKGERLHLVTIKASAKKAARFSGV